MAALLLMAAPFTACSSSPTGHGGSGAGGGSAGSGGSGGGFAGNGGGDSGPAGAGGSAGGGGSDAGVAGSDSGASGSAGTDGGAEGGLCSKNGADQACTDLANALCGLIYKCSPIVSQYDSEATCKTREHLACMTSLSLPGSGNPPANVEWQASTIKAVTCSDFYKFYAGGVTGGSPPCGASGTLADGKGCVEDGQCASGYCEQIGECGTCTEKAADGGSCYDDAGCKSAFCYLGPGTCTALAQVGESCLSSMYCAPGLYCDTTGACAQKKQAGEVVDTCSSLDADGCAAGLVCGSASQCEIPPLGAVGAACNSYVWNTCDTFHSVACDPATDKCVDNPPVAVGQSCDPLTGLHTPCVAGARCIHNVCVADAKDGAACDYFQGPRCTPPAQCIYNTCTVVDASVCPAN